MQSGGPKNWRRRGGNNPPGNQGHHDRWVNNYPNRYGPPPEDDRINWDHRHPRGPDWRFQHHESNRPFPGHSRHHRGHDYIDYPGDRPRPDPRHFNLRPPARFQDHSPSRLSNSPHPDRSKERWTATPATPETREDPASFVSPTKSVDFTKDLQVTDWKAPSRISVVPVNVIPTSPKNNAVPAAATESKSSQPATPPIPETSFSPPPQPTPAPPQPHPISSRSDYQSVVDLANKITSLGPLIRDPRLLSRVLKIQKQDSPPGTGSNPTSPEKGTALVPSVKNDPLHDQEIAKSISAECEFLSATLKEKMPTMKSLAKEATNPTPVVALPASSEEKKNLADSKTKPESVATSTKPESASASTKPESASVSTKLELAVVSTKPETAVVSTAAVDSIKQDSVAITNISESVAISTQPKSVSSKAEIVTNSTKSESTIGSTKTEPISKSSKTELVSVATKHEVVLISVESSSTSISNKTGTEVISTETESASISNQPESTSTTKIPGSAFSGTKSPLISISTTKQESTPPIISIPELSSVTGTVSISTELESDSISTEPELSSISTEQEELVSVSTEQELVSISTKPEYTEPELVSIPIEPESVSIPIELESVSIPMELESVSTEPELCLISNEPELTSISTEPEVTLISTEPESILISKQQESILISKQPEPVSFFSKPEAVPISTKSEFLLKQGLTSIITTPLLISTKPAQISTKPEQTSKADLVVSKSAEFVSITNEPLESKEAVSNMDHLDGSISQKDKVNISLSPESVVTSYSTPSSRAQSLVKDSFLKLKQEGRAKMSAPSTNESKQNQTLMKLVIDSESGSVESTSQQRPGNPPPFTKHPGLKSILNTVMKTSISKVLRTNMDAMDAAAAAIDVRTDSISKPMDTNSDIDLTTVEIEMKTNQNDSMGNATESVDNNIAINTDSMKVVIESSSEKLELNKTVPVNDKNGPESPKMDKLIEPEMIVLPPRRSKSASPKSEPVNQMMKRSDAGSPRPNTARKGVSAKQSPILLEPKIENVGGTVSPKTSPNQNNNNKGKKHKRRHFRGGTYGLYLSTPRRKKKKTSKSPEDSSVTGTETTESFIDSTDEGSCRSEDAHTNSERSFHEDASPDSSSKSQKDDKMEQEPITEPVKEALPEIMVPLIKIKQEIIEDFSEQKEPQDDEQSTDTLLSAPMSTSAKKSIPVKTKKDGLESIALSVKSRQRIKKRLADDSIDPIQEEFNYVLENETHLKKPRRNSTIPAASMKVIANLTNNETIGVNLKADVYYDSELPLLMCTCQAKPVGATTDEAVRSKIFCQAIDTIDEKLIGCCNEVSTHQLFRPSVKIPFTAMCEVHLWRLRHHQCCPVCGIFCSQGIFLQCNALLKGLHRNHLFHKECKITMKHLEMCLCPHCGCDSKMKPVALELNTPSATFYLTQKALLSEPLARMTFCRLNDVKPEEPASKSYNILDSEKVLSSAGLPFGADREQLEIMLEELDCQKLSSFSHSPEQIYVAARNGDIQKVLYMLASGSEPNKKFAEFGGDTALHAAAVAGHLVTLHLLLQGGASVDHLNNRLYTPLMVAIESRQLIIVQYLIKAGAQLSAKGEDGTTAIHLAARCGSLDICRVLLNTGRSMPNVQDDGGWTPIVWACEHSHLELVKILIERGADPNIRDNEENVALHWSAYSGNVDISQILLDLGCDISVVNEHGDTPLHIATRQNNYESVVLFLARGANIDIRNKEDEVPLMCCADQNTPTYMALLMNSKLKRMTQNRPLLAEKVIHRDISRGKELNPIQCVNGVDDEKSPFDFLYIIKNCETSPINIDRTITSLQSCQCEDDCTSGNCTCATISFKCWYDNEGKLLPEFNMPDPPMIFECNRACTCWKSCNNRVLQHGILSRLQLFRTKGKGWGVRTLKDITRGTFICEYIGEVISDSEADQREDDSYLFDLDNRDGETYCLDARYYGNISRFVNHLCEPNLVPVKVFVEHQDLSFPRIAFFSSRDIKAGEELGFDYGEKFWVIKYKWFTCACSSLHCKYSKDTIHHTLDSYYRRLREDHHEEDVESVPQLV